MNNEQKIQIARDYIAEHKDNNVFDWIPCGSNDDEKLLIIFSNLESGVYGEVIEKEDGFEIEISSHDSHSGNPIIFEWSK
jgi:hypothetical protein